MYNSLTKNLDTLKNMFASSADFTVRDMVLSAQNPVKAAIITIEGMCSKEVIALSVINPLLSYSFSNISPGEILEEIKTSVLTSSEIVEFNTFDEAIMFSTSGFALLAVDGTDRMIAIGVQGFPFRGVSEPESEVVQRRSEEHTSELQSR